MWTTRVPFDTDNDRRIIALTVVILAFCGSASGQSLYGPAEYGPPGVGSACACSFYYRPVCGSNGRTYSSICPLRCEQQYNPTIAVLSEGPCSMLIGSRMPNVGPIRMAGPVILSNTLPIYPRNPACVWQCPATTGSYTNAPGLQRPLGPASLPVTLGMDIPLPVCDNRGNVYLNDCQYYRAMCEWENRGLPLMKSPCPFGVRNGFETISNVLIQ
ncbi:uncharacterized protein LOC129588657 [Paramacrobiotus metropolitanus]|uniref:uncharacterized protein LOC129588657 n=1 Tax=Paramacrobiotus metropolitanus TaxID=2943436 RepID=UPI0024463EBF|nr:uncharacterized protein LOC129588657 [Paramacrobiotus metropolitanus]